MELARSTSRGGFSVRSIFSSVLTALLVAFLWVIFSGQTTFAASTAKWDGNDIVYEGRTYKSTTATTTSKPAMPNGSTYYHTLEQVSGGGKDYLISFGAGVNSTTATKAQYAVYNVDYSLNYTLDVTNEIDIVPKGIGSSSSSSTTAQWENGNLIFEGHTFSGENGSYRTSTGTKPPLKAGSKYYQYMSADGKKAYIIYFGSNSDPPKETSAQYITYDVVPSDIFGSGTNWINPSTAKSIKVDSTTAGNTTNGTPGAASTCTVPQLAWIVCPVTQFLAWAMDGIFTMLEGFFMVPPLSTQTDAPLYQAWNIVRSVANVAFVIAFLIIIYSQLTTIGISNYGLKKLAPRLIIAAVLVNLSYFICAIAVDLSNVIGSNTQDILVGIRDQINSTSPRSVPSWQSVSAFILAATAAGGAATVAIGGLIITTGASLGAALILLLPMLVGLIIAIVVALLVLAARQALIIILIILAPLAFVAYLLPNTEKLFEKWRSIFVTMLVFFPLFALIFGGSQLAAFLIINSIDPANANAINVMLLAMFVQVAPLVLTPLLVRFSGGIIGRIAGFVNDPKKGFIDRTRNWARDRSEYLAARNMARRDPVQAHQLFRRFALGADQQRRIREGRKTAYGNWSDSRWSRSRDFSDIDQLTREGNDRKTVGESRAGERYNTWKDSTPQGRRLETSLRLSQGNMENASQRLEQRWQESHRADVTRTRLTAETLAKDIQSLKDEHEREFAELQAGRVSRHLAGIQGVNELGIIAERSLRRGNIAKSALTFAQAQQQVEFAELLKSNIDVARDAGGIAQQGAERAMANADAVITRAKADTVKAIKDATAIRAGDVEAMANEIRNAANSGDVLTVRAYMDLLAESSNPGIDMLRRVTSEVEARLVGDDLQEVKEHLNANATVNSGAEDIGTWSRDTAGRSLVQVTRDIKTYNELTPMVFASNKKSTQIEAFKVGAIDATFARNILDNPGARGNLKPTMRQAIENIAAGRPWYEGVDVSLDED